MKWSGLMRLKRAGPLAHPILARLSRDSEFIRGMTSASLVILLSGCVSPQPIPQKVFINVPVVCIEADKAPKLPTVTQDAELAKQSDFDLVISIAADRIALRQYAKEADAAISACVSPK